jgi:hypothetical protein
MGLAGQDADRAGYRLYRGFELHSDVGGLWDIDGPKSTMYETAHLISSKKMTEFTDFPMDSEVAEYPSHRELKSYFRKVRGSFRRSMISTASARRCSRPSRSASPVRGWRVPGGKRTARSTGGVCRSADRQRHPVGAEHAEFKGSFSGELMHSSAYRDPEMFKGKRVLIIGAGNSGCDIAVDAIHHGKACDISMRRGYYFVPKYVFGRPADTMGGAIKLPMWLKRRIDGMILKWFTGDPSKYGFPKPDYALYESHPVVNSLILFHAGHGDITVRPDIDRFDGNTVHFKDGTQADYDLILAATGYKLHYPFIDKATSELAGRCAASVSQLHASRAR